MKKNKRIKRAVTLIEIMIVILLIGLIGGALAYNMSGSLEEGKAFKSRQNREKLHDILMIEYAKGDRSLQEIADHWKDVITHSSLVSKKNVNDILKDGWKVDYEIRIQDDEIVVNSSKLNAYEAKKTAPQA